MKEQIMTFIVQRCGGPTNFSKRITITYELWEEFFYQFGSDITTENYRDVQSQKIIEIKGRGNISLACESSSFATARRTKTHRDYGS